MPSRTDAAGEPDLLMFEGLAGECKAVFRWINSQAVESDNGFAVEFTDHFTLEYREGNLRILCQVEGGNPTIAVDVPSVTQPPFSHGGVRHEKRPQIIQNITEALEFMGFFPVVR
jgi:hypothetical protein